AEAPRPGVGLLRGPRGQAPPPDLLLGDRDALEADVCAAGHLPQVALDALRGVHAGRVVVAEVVDVDGDAAEVGDVERGVVEERDPGREGYPGRVDKNGGPGPPFPRQVERSLCEAPAVVGRRFSSDFAESGCE